MREMKNSFVGTLTISATLGILAGCNTPPVFNFLSNNTATGSVQVNVDKGAADKIADALNGKTGAGQSDQASGSSGLRPDQETKIDKLIDIASQSQQASPTVIVATTTIIVEPATASERVDTSFDEVVGEFSGRIPLRLSDGSIGSASVEVNDAVWSYVKNRVTAVFTGDVSGVYSHDEVGKAWEKEIFDPSQAETFEERHERLFQMVNATDSVGPIIGINWEKREMSLNPFYADGEATASIPDSFGVNSFSPRYLNAFALITKEMTFWVRGGTPQIKRKGSNVFLSLQNDVVKGRRVVWILDPLHRRVIPITQDEQGRYHLYRLLIAKI